MEKVMRFMGRYSLGRDNGMGSLHFLRIKIPGGVITSEYFKGIAELSREYGRGYAEITDRQDIQLHWIEGDDALDIFERLEKMGFTTDMCGQAFPGAGHGDVRNIVGCPLSGVNKDELIDGYPVIKELTRFFTGNEDFLDLPKKFKFSISGCMYNCTRAEINDMAFIPVVHDGEIGFTVLAGGGAGKTLPGPTLAKPLRVFLSQEEVFDVAVATVEIFRDHGNRESKAKARFKYLLDQIGVNGLRNMIEKKLGRKLEDYHGDVSREWIEHTGVGEQKDERYYVCVPLIGGKLSSDIMEWYAGLAEEYGTGDLRLTTFQNLIIVNVEDKEGLLKELGKEGVVLKGIIPKWTAVGCASDFCGKTKEYHSKEIVRDIVEHLETSYPNIFVNQDFKIGVSGCPNNCGYSVIASVGLEGRLIRVNGSVKQGYDIYLRGKLENGSIGRRVAEGVPAENVVNVLNKLLEQYKIKLKNESEIRFVDFLEKLSDTEIKKLVEVT